MYTATMNLYLLALIHLHHIFTEFRHILTYLRLTSEQPHAPQHDNNIEKKATTEI